MNMEHRRRSDRDQSPSKPGDLDPYPRVEQWRSIIGYNYEVSDLGRVRNSLNGRILRPGHLKSGHLTVQLGRTGSQYVHRLVAAAFIGPCPPGLEVRHLNDNPSCNEWSNITYGSRTENNRDKKWNKGQSNFKLTPDQVREIKLQLKWGIKGADIALEFGIWAGSVSAIKHGRYHVDVLP